jgi:hypothetical protein
MLLWGIFVALISPAIYVRLAAFGRFSAAFEVGELWAFTRANIGNVILAIILLALAAWIVVPIIGLLGLIVCLVGVLISLPFSSLWQSLLTAHLYGQIGAHGNRAVRTPVPEPVPSLPSQYYEEPSPVEVPAVAVEEMAPVEGLIVPEEPEAPISEATPVEGPAGVEAEPPSEPPVSEEKQ